MFVMPRLVSRLRAFRLGIPFARLLAAINSARWRVMKLRPIQINLLAGLARDTPADIAIEIAQRAAENLEMVWSALISTVMKQLLRQSNLLRCFR
jgi:hypothetical protein